MIIKAKRITGQAYARNTLKMQMNGILMYSGEVPACKGIENCFPGTLNLELEQNLFLQSPDLVTPPLKWHPKMTAEAFAIKLIEISFGGEFQNAWIYDATGSPHRFTPNLIEVITPEITISQDECEIRLPASASVAESVYI